MPSKSSRGYHELGPFSYEGSAISDRLTGRCGACVTSVNVSQRLGVLCSRFGWSYCELLAYARAPIMTIYLVDHVYRLCRTAQNSMFRMADSDQVSPGSEFFLFFSISTSFYQTGLPTPLVLTFVDATSRLRPGAPGPFPVFKLTLRGDVSSSILTLTPPQ